MTSTDGMTDKELLEKEKTNSQHYKSEWDKAEHALHNAYIENRELRLHLQSRGEPSDMEMNLRATEQTVVSLMLQLEQTRSKLCTAKSYIKDLKLDRDEAEKQVAELEMDIAELRSAFKNDESANRTYQLLTEEYADLQQKFNALAKSEAALRKQVENLEAQKEDIANHSENKEKYWQQKYEIEMRNRVANDSLKLYDALETIDDLKVQVESYALEQREMSEMFETSKVLIANLERQLEETKEAASSDRESSDEYTDDLKSQMKLQRMSSEREITALKNSLQAAKTEQEATLLQLNQDCTLLEKNFEKLMGTHRTEVKRMSTVMRKNRWLTKSIRMLSAQRRSEIQKLNEEASKHQEELEKLRREKEQFASECLSRISGLLVEIRSHRIYRDELQKSLKELDELKKASSQMNKEMEALKKDKDTVMAEADHSKRLAETQKLLYLRLNAEEQRRSMEILAQVQKFKETLSSEREKSTNEIDKLKNQIDDLKKNMGVVALDDSSEFSDVEDEESSSDSDEFVDMPTLRDERVEERPEWEVIEKNDA